MRELQSYTAPGFSGWVSFCDTPPDFPTRCKYVSPFNSATHVSSTSTIDRFQAYSSITLGGGRLLIMQQQLMGGNGYGTDPTHELVRCFMHAPLVMKLLVTQPPSPTMTTSGLRLQNIRCTQTDRKVVDDSPLSTYPDRHFFLARADPGCLYTNERHSLLFHRTSKSIQVHQTIKIHPRNSSPA